MLILDASAAVDLVVMCPKTHTIRQLIRDEPLFAPHLIYSEALSALRRLERTGKLSAEEAGIALHRLKLLPIRTAWSSDWLDLSWDAREWLRLTDALYFAASQRLGGRVLTTDLRLARALTDRSIPVLSV